MSNVDYLVVGAGAMGMAFVDVILTESDATVALVDRRAHPGGHWNDAYPHVRLHQPSAYYGVNSRELGTDALDQHGWNEGLNELASGPEIVGYFDQVLRQQFLGTGRVQYFPLSNYEGNGTVRSLVTGKTTSVSAAKVVNATYMNVTVPSTRPPGYDVADTVTCVPPNNLGKPGVLPGNGTVVIGGGKTAIDACLFLLEHGVPPDDITWIRPREQWLIDRSTLQPAPELFDRKIASQASQMQAIAESETIEDMFTRLEATGVLVRIDTTIQPTMFRCASVTLRELEAVRTITNVVRLGRVQRITPTEIVLDDGAIATSPEHIHVDCTADGLQRRPVLPIFDGNTITLQTVRTCQQVFSAAFIAHVELNYDTDTTKNDLATVVPHPDSDIDWLRTTLAVMNNSTKWRNDAALNTWLANARLNQFRRSPTTETDSLTDHQLATLKTIGQNFRPATERLANYLEHHNTNT